VQYAMAVAQNVPTTFYYYNGSDDIFLGWITDVVSMRDPPLVFSISYGSPEDSVPPSYMAAFNIEAMKLSVRGVTLLTASGDDGAMGHDGRPPSSKCRNVADFPSSSQYVTSVGATMGPEQGAGRNEIACMSQYTLGGYNSSTISTGGGFSNVSYNLLPRWQRAAVTSYFTSRLSADYPGVPLTSYGRGFPDVSALGNSYPVIVGGQLHLLSGTSASSPVVAGMVSLINSARIAAGKSPVGWLNPALYYLNSTITVDITVGSNKCSAVDCSGAVCSVNCCGSGVGYSAAPGWDPVTGLGVLDFEKFKAAMMGFTTPTASPIAPPSVAPSVTAAPVSTRSPTLARTAAPSQSLSPSFSSSYSPSFSPSIQPPVAVSSQSSIAMDALTIGVAAGGGVLVLLVLLTIAVCFCNRPARGVTKTHRLAVTGLPPQPAQQHSHSNTDVVVDADAVIPITSTELII